MRERGKSNVVADFETTTQEDDCRVWCWALCDTEDFSVETGLDIQSFCDAVANLDANVWFHNLAFDGSFIIDYLLRHGFTHKTENRLKPLEFSTLISRMGKFYSITVVWDNGTRTEFKDSLKKLPMSAANVAQAFKLEESKGSIDYEKSRPVGYVPTREEWEYVVTDVRIIARALRVQLDEGMTRLTVGSDSLAEFKKLITQREFDRLFPSLPLSMDADIRQAYRGGFTYVRPDRTNQVIGPGRTYDVNSLYPYVMYDKVLPFGEPVWFDGAPCPTDDYPLFVVSVTVVGKIKANHIPCIQIKANSLFSAIEYQTEIEDAVTLVCTSVDLKLWQDHYDLQILSYNGGWKFQGCAGFFNVFIDKWMHVKATSSGGIRTIAKLHLNSLYGKFATNPDITPKNPVMEDDRVRLIEGEPETRNPVYVPMGAFITAYARDVTIRAAQQNYDEFVYADTDSLHLVGEGHPDNLTIDPSALGAWKHEYDWDAGIFVRAKCYSERVDGRYETHIAGAPHTVTERMTFDDFVDGKVFPGKLLPKRVPGGIVLTDVGFTLNM